MEKLHNCAKKVALHCHRNDTSYNKKRIETGFKRSRSFQQRRYCEGTQVQFPYPAVKHDQCGESYLEQRKKCAESFVATYVANKADKSLCGWVRQSPRDFSALLFEKFHHCFDFFVQSCLIGERKLTPVNQVDTVCVCIIWHLIGSWLHFPSLRLAERTILKLNSSKVFLFLLSFSKYFEAKRCAKNVTLENCDVTPQLQDDVNFIYDEFNPFCRKLKDPSSEKKRPREKPRKNQRRSAIQDVEGKILPSRGKKITSKVSILVAVLCSVLSIIS